ncbi:hypothetical protein [Planctopirus hydrillae]|uniref:Uncharacterized protein n=1 Tax=Planctopirus hydrillae TaxID=1841610 RepID=A0A1C3EDW4_9PLAN|nr:hypothetical protein [Planctopirus hydrillae]ODA31441.1 hypothetical protein A6X21_22420 [Planctopirus hydrillae]
MSTDTPPLPSFVTRLKHFFSALTQHAADGFEKVSEEQLQERLSICQQCPSFTGTHCRECGCSCSGNNTFLNKLAWRSEACPLSKWPALTEETPPATN